MEHTSVAVKPALALRYAALVGVPLAGLAAVLILGHANAPGTLVSPAAAAASGAAGIPNVAALLTQIAVIILASRAMGWLAQALHQPRVIGETLAGILLGPSLLGWLAPGFFSILFPPASFGILYVLSQLGLALFMFMVGLQLNVAELRQQGPAALLISHASIATPMALGALLAVTLYPRFAGSVTFPQFALFMGTAMSVTAFPVLARILTERKMLGSRIGTLAIACAAIDDVTGWCVLAVIVGQLRSGHSALPVWMSIVGLAVFMALMMAVRSPLAKIESSYRTHGELSNDLKALLLLLLMFSALATEVLGLHLVFGAFVAGTVLPRNRDFATYLISRFDSLTEILLLPLFFAYTGLRTRIGEVKGAGMWGVCALILLVAVAGKVGGSGIAARVAGMTWRESLGLGALMNTRGLMELVVLNIGMDIGVITPALFSMLVLMAIATTMMTPPLLQLVYPAARPASEVLPISDELYSPQR